MGNRLHLAFKRQVPTEQAQAYAERLGVTFFEVSPLCNFNITESFMELARIVLLRHGMDRLWRPSKGKCSSRLPGSPSSAQPHRTWPQVAVSILINQSFCPMALEPVGMECPLVGASPMLWVSCILGLPAPICEKHKCLQTLPNALGSQNRLQLRSTVLKVVRTLILKGTKTLGCVSSV